MAAGLAVSCLGVPLAVAAQDGLPLAYMRAGDYRSSSFDEKVALSRDFMRSFCGSPRMPIVAFVRCVDQRVVGHSSGQPVFDDLKHCVRTLG